MARFHGKVGFGVSTETTPGVWTDVVTEYDYKGDIVQNRSVPRQGEKVNDDLSVSNSISIVADAQAREHYTAIKYVIWAGTRWTVSSVSVERPLLVLQLVEVYNGPTPAGAP